MNGERARLRLLAVAIAAALCPTAAASAAPLQLSSASALDTRTIELRFDQPLGNDLIDMVAANNSNTSYVHQFVRIAGGQAGEPDAALTGTAALSAQVSGTRNYNVETAGRDRLRVVLGAGTSLVAGRTYTLKLDAGDGTPLSNLLMADASGTSTPEVAFTGSGTPAAAVTQPTATVRDSRVIRLAFNEPIVSGMPIGAYTNTSNFVLMGGAAPAAPVYIEPVPDSDRKQWDLQFAADLDPSATYSLAIAARTLNLQTYGAIALPGNTTWTLGGLSGAADAYAAPAIASATVNAARNELRVKFNHRVKWVVAPSAVPFSGTGAPPSPPGTIFVRETSDLRTAGGHSELHPQDIRAMFDLDAAVQDDDGQAAPWNLVSSGQGNAADRLRDDAAYWVDRSTLAIRFQSGVRLSPGTTGHIALKPNVVTDVTGKTSTAQGAQVDFATGIAPVTATAPGYDAGAADYLSVDEHAETTFRHFDYTYDSTGMFVPSANVKDRVVDQKIPAVVVGNKYLKVLFTPQYGGRMQSIVYKPTGHDLLYTNPVGTPYGNGTAPGSSPFYNGWLMVYGGVFPTFTEAEHGKYWFVPWDYEVKKYDDRIELVESKTDDFNLPGHPSKFPYGVTGLKITVTYTVYKDSPVPHMNVRIENPTSTAKQYEYWTCTTLGPGGSSDPYGTSLSAASPETDVVSPNPIIKQYSGYTWMRQVEDQASPAESAGFPPIGSGEQYLRVNHLKRMINWSNNGIAYGQGLATNPQGNWWGVVDRTSGEGVLRLGDNAKTPGMKYWEWGFNGSFATNPYSKGNSGRPYVELWAGTSREFFVPDVLQPGEVKEFDQAFMPTMDMKDTTNADPDGAALIEYPGDRTVTARVFSTHIGRTQTAKLVDAVSGRTIASQTFVASPLKSVELSGFAPHGTTAKLVLTDADGTTLLTAQRSDGLDPEPVDFEEGTVGGTVPATLALSLGGPASFGAFTPGADKEYTAGTQANVVSTAGNATLSVAEPGHLANGAFSLPEALRVELAPATWTGPVSNASAAITFRQHIGRNDALRTGSYSTTLTFTLSTTAP